jgi:hypothetical protein
MLNMPPDQTSEFKSPDSSDVWTKKLKPISPQRLKQPKPQEKSSTDLPLDGRLRLGRLVPTWSPVSPRPLSTRLRTTSPTSKRCLDFDVETRAKGFGDPDWVPQEVTAIAWSWCDEDHVYYATLLDGIDYMFVSFVEAYDEADIVTGHNVLRFDLPVLNSDLMRHDYPPLKAKKVQDTMRIVKTKGFKKGQDNLSTLLHNPVPKMAMNWQEWQDAYEESDWRTIIDRVVSDVRGHKLLRAEMLARGWLRPARVWSP